MPLVTTYQQVGIKEDISNIITNISPTATPLQSVIGGENIKNIKHQWQEDSLAAPNVSNAAIQGADAPSSSFTPTVLRDNITQIFTTVAMTSGTADVVDTYGRAKELAYQMMKKSKEIKRDFEAVLLSGQTRVVGDGATVAGKFDAVQVMIDSTHKFHAADASTTLNGAALAAFNETVLMTANQTLYVDGGEATVLMIKPQDSKLIAAFAAATGRSRLLDTTAKKIVNVVDVYVSPFGEQKVVMNRFMKVTDALLFDPSNWKKLTLRNWSRETLAKTGDSTKIQLLGEFSLKHTNFKASALITDLSTPA